MTAHRRTVLVLAACQALFQTSAVLIATVGALAGQLLAPERSLATLPIAAVAVGTALATFPASLLMGRFGRRPGFVLGTLLGAAGGAIAALGLVAGSFALFCLGNLLVGGHQGFAQFYRFAAADAAAPAFKAKAISFVLAGGVVAAIAGPLVGTFARDLVSAGTYAGSYLAVVALSLTATLLLARNPIPSAAAGAAADDAPPRPLALILRQPTFLVALGGAAIGYGVMVLAMTATPLAMVAHRHAVDDAALVIQGHVLGMYLPSFFTGALIQRFGVLGVMFAGVTLLAGHLAISMSGVALPHFFSALVLLGVGWNFLFVGGTALLTETYRPNEKAKVQALNDFLIFGVVVLASLASGALLQGFGWQGVNLVAAPFLLLAGVAVAALALHRRARPSLSTAR